MKAKKLIGGLFAGALIGVTAGFLLAPEGGEKTRRKIAKKAKKLTNSLRDTTAETFQSLKTSFNETVDEVAIKGKQHINSTSEELKV